MNPSIKRIILYLIALFIGYFLGGIVNTLQRVYNERKLIEFRQKYDR